jgi:S1-C subfamily serine protease
LPESYPWPRLAETLTPAVVNIRTASEASAAVERRDDVPEPFRRFLPPELWGRLPGRPMRGLGYGFIIDPGGLVVTSNHVVHRAKSVEVTLSDGRKLPGTVMGTDPETDLALLKVEATACQPSS